MVEHVCRLFNGTDTAERVEGIDVGGGRTHAKAICSYLEVD